MLEPLLCLCVGVLQVNAARFGQICFSAYRDTMVGLQRKRINKIWWPPSSSAIVAFYSATILVMRMAAGFHLGPFFSSRLGQGRCSAASSPAPESSTEPLGQNFESFFLPVKRPLRLRTESQPERGFWFFEQPLHTLPTLEVDVRMAVFALTTGSILAFNPLAPTEEMLEEFNDTFGEPDHIIFSTSIVEHLVYASGWIKRFPRATVWTLKGINFPEAGFAQEITPESLPKEWLDELDFCIYNWGLLVREVYVLHRSTKVLLAMDTFVDLHEQEVPNPMLRMIFKSLNIFGQPVCPIKPLVWNRKGCRETASKMLEWDFEFVYPTHGSCPVYDGKKAVRNAFEFLWD